MHFYRNLSKILRSQVVHMAACTTFLLLSSLFFTGYAQPADDAGLTHPGSFVYQNGDILFQDLDCGPLCAAIEAVTQGAEGRSFSHLGLVYRTSDSLFVIEAIGEQVQLTPIHQFLYRNVDPNGNPKILVSRLQHEYKEMLPLAIQYALQQIGVPYDDAFLYDNERYYCSELIYDAFKFANGNEPFFELGPMTFKDPETGQVFPAWKEYYQKLGIQVPEGEPGCNPGGISRDPKLRPVAWFY